MSNIQQNNTPDFNDERFLDLMIQRATTGLSELEQQELDQLATVSNNQDEPERFEVVAAAFDLANSGGVEQLPGGLRDQILVEAGSFFGNEPSDKEDSGNSSIGSETVTASRPELESKISKGITVREAIGWLAAAACIALLLSGANPFANKPGDGNTKVASIPVDQQLADFLANKPADLVEEEWVPVQAASEAGRVVWSDSQQKGFMIFKDLPPNNSDVEQYQLWIFDTDTNQLAPVDGGVFDIVAGTTNANGEYVIPIRPHVVVDKAVQFAITIERPGGVYRSDRSRLPVLAEVAKNL